MNTLFPIEPVLPQGFEYLPEFITKDEEKKLVEETSQVPLSPMKFHGYEARRKVSSFGYDWSFESRTLTKGKPVPQAFDLIAGISLLADCTFRLRPYNKTLQSSKSVISFPVHRCSLYIISGESRSDWEHSIAPVKSKRYSITLRTLKK